MRVEGGIKNCSIVELYDKVLIIKMYEWVVAQLPQELNSMFFVFVASINRNFFPILAHCAT